MVVRLNDGIDVRWTQKQSYFSETCACRYQFPQDKENIELDARSKLLLYAGIEFKINLVVPDASKARRLRSFPDSKNSLPEV